MQEQAKPAKKKKGGCGTVILAVLLVLVAAAAFVAFTLFGEINGKEGGAQVTVTIEQGSGPATIGRKLADAGVIRYPTVFRLYTGQTGKAGQLQYGEFTLTEGMGYDAILEALSRRDRPGDLPRGHHCTGHRCPDGGERPLYRR